MAPSRGPAPGDVLPSLPPDEERAILNAYLDQHYRAVLDEKIPMLGNITPRAAAKTVKGRQKLVSWLKFLENGIAKDAAGKAGYDLTWMWEELGIIELRR